MSMKQPYFIMSLLTPGPNSLTKDIDVYLRPLIDELKGIWTYDIYMCDAYNGSTFFMHAALL